ncbi:hypothetical protein NLI96_g11087 [Meripilus lineatus]|uniref:thymidylate synthase n=1 Tax=Meripilus lineatus TaxID=2056292 RepID=A0AAD5USE3_9APHY|nr:hypothetical protein NLI96_g11087 [Physisporinus lineatus]
MANTTTKPVHDEYQYLNLIRSVLDTGETRPDRTGTGTLSIFAPPSLRFSLSDSTLPLLTTKRTFLRGIVEELLWFIQGSTDSTLLSKKGVKIWDGNGSKEFLEKRGLVGRREGDLGPVYGFQWRHFGAEYVDCERDYEGKGVDQLKECVRKIKEEPTDRRIILSAWNPADIPLMALPPCHMMCQFYVHLPPSVPPNANGTTEPVRKPKLSCLMYQRSADLGLGIPFNIASYALLTHMMAQVTNTEAHELIIQLGDAHVYRDHVDALEEQLKREPRAFPKVRWRRDVRDIDDFKAEDIVVEGPRASLRPLLLPHRTRHFSLRLPLFTQHGSPQKPSPPEPESKPKILPATLKENIYTIPNLLTVSRIIACPILGWAIVQNDFVTATSLLVYAGLTDLVDGFLARRFKMQSVLGTILDPAADKTLMTTLTITLAIKGMVPVPLAVIILGRDVLLSLSAFYIRYTSLPQPKTWTRYWDFSIPSAEVHPTAISKVNTALQLLLMGTTTISPLIPADISLGLQALQWIVGTTTVWSGASYIFSKDAVKIVASKTGLKP